MSGLFGWVGRAEAGRESLEAMADALNGAAFATTTTHHSEHGCALGGRSAPESLHWTREGAIVAAIDGYPRWTDPPLATLATDKGAAEALIEAFRRHGADCITYLSGPFQIAVVDMAAGEALLAIDRMGVHGCVYAEPPDGGLVFGASADAILAHPAVERRLSTQGLYNYFSFFVSPAPDMVFAGQRKLLAGQRLRYRNGRATVDHYWQMPYTRNGDASETMLAEQLRSTFGDAIERSLAGEDASSVGAFLSGGLDSTTVCAYLGNKTNTAPRCFTTGFDEDGYDETPFAALGARHIGADHHVHRLTPRETLDFLPTVAAAYDEPFGNSSAIPAYYCAREAASRGVKVMLAGDGGDELFAGNKSYVEQLRYEAITAIPRMVRAPLRCLLVLSGGLGEAFPLLRRARNALTRADVALPERLRIFSLFHRTAPEAIFTPEFLADVDVERPLALLRSRYEAPETTHPLQRMMNTDLQLILADNDLRKVVRMCERAGVRVKFPMLDDGLVQFTAAVPPAMMMTGRSIRSFYKSAMAPILPRAILDKEKHGFGMPFDLWIQTDKDLNGVACETLRAIGKRGIFRAEPLERTAQDLAAGRSGPLGQIAWDIMMCELWLQSRSLEAA